MSVDEQRVSTRTSLGCNLSEVSENYRLDRQIDMEEIAQCVKEQKKTRLGGVMGSYL